MLKIKIEPIYIENEKKNIILFQYLRIYFILIYISLQNEINDRNNKRNVIINPRVQISKDK